METNSAQSNKSVSRPTLLANPSLGVSAGDNTEQARILSTANMPLELKSKDKQPSKRSGYKTFAYLGAVALAAVLGYQYWSTPALPVAPAIANKSTPQTAGSVNIPADTSTAQAPVAQEAAQEAAQIVNESVNTTAAKPVTSEAKITNALEEGVSPAPAALKKALNSKSPPVPVAQTTPKAAVVSANAEKKPRTEPSPDKDVNLLAALITHGNTTASTGSKQPAAIKTYAPTPAEKYTVVAAATSEKTGQTLPNTAGTDQLLKQCSELGFFQREVCRIKTCNTKWDTDIACKASLSTNSSAGSTLEALQR